MTKNVSYYIYNSKQKRVTYNIHIKSYVNMVKSKQFMLIPQIMLKTYFDCEKASFQYLNISSISSVCIQQHYYMKKNKPNKKKWHTHNCVNVPMETYRKASSTVKKYYEKKHALFWEKGA